MTESAATPRWRRRVAVAVVLMLLLYWPLAFLATHVPMEDISDSDLPLDKIFHFCSFGVISFLLTGALGLQRGWRWKWAVYAIAICAAYGVIDELTQIPFGRQADVKDWLMDVAGAATGALIAATICEIAHRRRQR